MNENYERFIGNGMEGISFNFTPEEKREARKRREQFDAELLLELNGNTNPTEEEEFEAAQKVLDRWFPEEAKHNALLKKKRGLFEQEVLRELGGNANPSDEEREAARRRVLDRQ